MPRLPSWFPFVVCAVLSTGCAAQVSGMQPAGSVTMGLTADARGAVEMPRTRKAPDHRSATSSRAFVDPLVSLTADPSIEIDRPTPNDPGPDDPTRGGRALDVTITLGGGPVDDASRVIYGEHLADLEECMGGLSRGVDGRLLVRLHVDPPAEVTAVTIGWRFEASAAMEPGPAPLVEYADAVECIEGVLLDASVPGVDPGDHALALVLAVRP